MKALLASLAVLTVVAASAAQAGDLAPVPRVVAERDRDFLERSGAQTLEELLDTGIVRYFFTGGQTLLVLVDGRPYATTSSDLDTLPLSAVERIELLSGESLGTLGGSAVSGAINVVLRKDLDGFETRSVVRMPSRDGGDGLQGSVFWGGAVGDKGHMTLGVDVLDRQEIPGRSRDFSRSVWREGGAFNEAQNVSVGGNTVWVVQTGDDGIPTGVRSIPLGDCDPAHGYTGPLSNPPGITSGDKGCGFAYGNIWWNTSSYQQRSAILNLDQPLTAKAELHVDVNITQGDSAFRYAPSIDSFIFTPSPGVLDAINDAADSAFVADNNDAFVAAHRFVSHGNRDWLTDTEEFDVSVGVKGRIEEDLGYDARISAYRLDGFVDGNTFVHLGSIQSEIEEGHYDLADPFSTAPEHLQAIENSSLRLENDFGAEFLGARLALEGSGFVLSGLESAWTAGVELGSSKAHDISVYRSNDGVGYDVSEVLGSGGASYSGERTGTAAFAEMSVPVTEFLDFRLGGRGDDYDDVGPLRSWRVGADVKPIEAFTLRGSLSAGERSPPMLHLYSFALQDHPYVECDPGPGSPPRSCQEINPRQVTRVTAGNPDLDPSDTGRVAFGAEARQGPLFLDVEWYRLSRSGLSGQNNADWAMQNLNECMGGDRTNCIDRTAGDITIYDSYANIVETEISGITARYGGTFGTDWGELGMSGAWRYVNDAELRIAGNEDRYVISRNMARVRFMARRRGLTAIWTVNYREGFKNRSETGEFKSWTGHDVALEWKEPLGLQGGRVAAGVFNLTDESLTVDTANPSSVDGPTAAGWGRTFFLTVNVRF